MINMKKEKDTEKETEKEKIEPDKKTSGPRRYPKYLRELSVVIIGVAITFLGSDWIGRQNEKKDLERYLETLRIELEMNLTDLGENIELYDKTTRLSRLLLSDHPQNLPADSLYAYMEIVPIILFPHFRTSAYETLKTSGMIRFIPDSTFRAIQESYNLLKITEFDAHNYMTMKMREVYESLLTNSQFGAVELFNTENKRLYHFLMTHANLEEELRECSAQIKSTLGMLSQK